METVLKTKQGIYVELDALLDTRLPILHKLDPVKALDILKSNYFTRKTNSFEGFDKEQFDAAYLARDKSLLKNALVTRVIDFINEVVRETINRAITTPESVGPKLFVNIFPYELSEEEINVLATGIVLATNRLTDVQVVRLSPQELTPSFCKSNLAIMFVYNYAQWLETQVENFKRIRCPEISVICPGIYFGREPTEDEMDSILSKGKHPFTQIEESSLLFINLCLQDIGLFCIKPPKIAS